MARTYGGGDGLGRAPKASLTQRTARPSSKTRRRRQGGVRASAGEELLLDAGSTAGALAHELRGFDKL
ncbi:hypothetical protein [Arthrobacter sp. P2b]|uniref:hypothetical protein n=1 Tax=Arthrobacter sp. P2b TaxID=1938741 RepID=UPI0015914187|nr:hypothetical protein [Arthrobacter sp. P2b]